MRIHRSKWLFPAPYCSLVLLLLSTAATAWWVVFFSSSSPLLQNITDGIYWLAWIYIFLPILLIYYLLGRLSFYLDHAYPWQGHLLLRSVLQFVIGIVILGFIFFILVFLFSKSIVVVEAFSKEYLERDFIVLMCGLVIMNFLHVTLYYYHLSIRYEQDNKGLLQQTDDDAMRVKEFNELELSYQQKLKESELGLQLFEQYERKIAVWELDREIQPLSVMSFNLVGKENNKGVSLLTWSGLKYTVKEAKSLQAIEQLYPRLFVKLTRDLLINKYLIGEFKKCGAKHYEVVFVKNLLPSICITLETYKKLVPEDD